MAGVVGGVLAAPWALLKYIMSG